MANPIEIPEEAKIEIRKAMSLFMTEDGFHHGMDILAGLTGRKKILDEDAKLDASGLSPTIDILY